MKLADVDTRTVISSFRFSGKPLDTRFIAQVASLSSDGRVLSLIRQDNTIATYDAMTGRQLPATFHAPTAFQQLDRHGRRLLVGESDGTNVWDIASGRRLLKIPYPVGDTDTTPDEKYLVTTHGTAVDLWDLDTGRKARTLRLIPGKKEISNMALSPDGRLIALRQGDRLWVGAFDRPAKWGMGFQTAKSDGRPTFSPDSRYVAIQGTVWDARDYQGWTPGLEEPIFKYANPGCGSYTFGPGGRTLRCVNFENVVTVLSLGAILDPADLVGPGRDPILSRDGSTIATGDYVSPAVEIWDPVKRVRRKALLSEGDVVADELSTDGRLLAVAHPNGDIEIFDVPSATRKATLATHQHLENEPFTGDTAKIAVSPDSKTLAVLTNGNGKASLLELWDIASRTRRATSTGQPPAGGQDRTQSQAQTFSVRILFSGDGRTVVSAPDQGVVDVATGRRLTAPNFAVGTPEAENKNGLLAAANDADHKISLWDGRSLRLVDDTTLGGSPEAPSAFSPDGRILAVADQTTNQIRLWDLTRRQALGGPLNGFFIPKEYNGTGMITRLAFTPDGSAVLAVDTAGRLRTHLVAPGKIKAALCTQSGPLPKAAWKTHIPEIPYRNTC